MSFPSWASRVAWVSAMVALALIAAPGAKADVVKTFDLSGSSVTKDTFAGTIDLDFTNDTATSVDVIVDKSSVSAYAFKHIVLFTFAHSAAVVYVSDSAGDELTLFFTVPTPFVDFVGGTIAAQGRFGGGTGGFLYYAPGSITPVTPIVSNPPPPVVSDPPPPVVSDPPPPVLSDPDPPSVPAVPEPSTWVMLLLGFVGLGLAAKGRRAIRFLAKA
jgi:PEP-CTERM motif